MEALSAQPAQGPRQLAFPIDVGAEAANAELLLVTHLANSLADDTSLYLKAMTVEDLFKLAMVSRFGEYRRTLYRSAASMLDREGRLVVHERKMRAGLLQWQAVIELQ